MLPFRPRTRGGGAATGRDAMFNAMLRRQEEIDRIRASIRSRQDAPVDCGCLHYAGIYVRFPDGSFKRPDVAVFCRRPDEDEEAVTLAPEAVIEVISKGYESKDLEIGSRFYVSQGVKDVIVFDPATLLVLHLRQDRAQRLVSPVQIDLVCGCRVTV